MKRIKNVPSPMPKVQKSDEIPKHGYLSYRKEEKMRLLRKKFFSQQDNY